MSGSERSTPDDSAYLAAIGAFMRARRKAAGLTYAQAAERGGISVAGVQRVEAGETDTASTKFLRLLAAYGNPVGDVLAILSILSDPEPTPEKGRLLAEQPPETPPLPDRLAALTAELARDAERDPELLAALGGFLAGRRSRV